MTPSTSVRRTGETARNMAARPKREIARTMDFVSIIGFRLVGRLPTTVMIWYLYQGFTARTGLQSEPRPGYPLGPEGFAEIEVPVCPATNLHPFRGFAESTGVRPAVPVRAPGGVAWKALFERYMIEARGSSLPPGGNS